jgi:phosphoglycerol transferase MdoB-like AlkP superfamily enzyme
MGTANAEQGTKVTSYIMDVLHASKFLYWILLVIPIIFIVYYVVVDRKIYKNRIPRKFTMPQRIYIEAVTLIAIVALSGLYYYTIKDDKFQNEIQTEKNYYLWLFPENSNLTANNFGVLMYLFCDIKSQIQGIDSDYILKLQMADITQEEKKEDIEKIPVDKRRVIDDTAWKTLQDNTSDENFRSLNTYFMNRNITQKNDMTGIFKGKNLIIILMESVDEIAILNKEDFPTLYKMYHEGISFRNNFSPRNNCSTGNNEFTVLTSLFTINNTCTANAYAVKFKFSEASYNIFKKAGYATNGFHDYTQQYYYRNRIHPNLGADHFYGVQELGMSWNEIYEEWPSDKVMFQQAKDKYMNNDKFFTYFAAVTTHQTYNVPSEWGDAYSSRWANTNYSTNLKRYLSKMTELDNALAELLSELEKEGKLDDTVIAMFGDHYPYGLTDSNINQYLEANNAGYTVNHNSTTDKNVDRTPMLIYNSALEAPIEVTDYTTIIDLLPTLLNLFDMDYDPRLYLGTDVFSETHVSRAYFADGSWQDDRGFYYAPGNKMTYLSGATQYSDAELKSINFEINTRQRMSGSAIRSNYFNYLGEGLEKYKPVVVEEPKVEEEKTESEE